MVCEGEADYAGPAGAPLNNNCPTVSTVSKAFYVLSGGRHCGRFSDNTRPGLTFNLVAIFNVSFPIARLAIDVEGEPSGTAHRSQACHAVFSSLITPVQHTSTIVI